MYENSIVTLNLQKYTYEECFDGKLKECMYPLDNSIHHGGFGGSHFSQVSTGSY